MICPLSFSSFSSFFSFFFFSSAARNSNVASVAVSDVTPTKHPEVFKD
jgi:hypothetical protein